MSVCPLAVQIYSKSKPANLLCDFNDQFVTLPLDMGIILIVLFIAIVFSSRLNVMFVISGEAQKLSKVPIVGITVTSRPG